MEPPPHKLGYPTGSKPPPLVLKSASYIQGLNNNNQVLPHAKDPFQLENKGHHYLDFLDISETVFARQLTRMDSVSLWTVIKNGNFLPTLWPRRNCSNV